MKYNVKAIMARAWEIKKQDMNNYFGLCLRMAWEEAKSEKKEYKGYAVIGGESLMDSAKAFKAWAKNGLRRIYINREDGKKTYGYIDLNRDNALVCDSDIKATLTNYVERFFAAYRVA